MKFRVLGFGSDQDGYVFVGVLPKAKEILVGGAGPWDIPLQDISTSQPHVRKRANDGSQNDASMV